MASHGFTCVGFSPKLNWKTVEFLLPMPVYRICSVCGVVPDMIFSLECAHVFCPTCMNEIMVNSPATVCPLDKLAFEDARVSRDSSSAEYVVSCKSYCLNKATGCNYVGPVSEMIEHYDSECSFHKVRCRVCKRSTTRANVLTHVRDGCSADTVLAETATTPTGASAATAGGSDADNNANLTIILSKIDNLEQVILARTRDLQHILVDRSHAAATDGSQGTVVQSEQPEVSSTALEAPPPLLNGRASGDSLSSDTPSETSQRDGADSQSFANQVQQQQEQQEEASSEASPAAELSPEPLTTFNWAVKQFRKLRHTPAKIFSSDNFYVGENGYKMRLEGKFHMVSGTSLTLGLYLRLLRGKNDARLEWPFNKKCTFVLVHSKHRHRDLTFTVGESLDEEERQNATNAGLSRPRTEENPAVGIDSCILASQMLQGGFVKDSIFRVRFVVS
ncbi:putative Tnf receptor-associated factor [Ixodes scapularis]|uniref:Tnf receptor-associated factor, putative n=1 Tax=Ixodes scapularis TaxID=6945 RepID=B7QJX9_IXOSC|nr:Tnf receptor-associated factor, putative [Ixodes scapularis]|eukprot:XP_002415486.1 Tnf receptor-associated factor, putative [Ixodes scapularis]